VGWTMGRCVDCDREGCQKVEAWTSFVACNCAISMANPCEHQKAAHTANADCKSHTVNWRERALAAEARQAWVPVGERLPEDGVDVLAVSNSGVTDAYVLFDMDGLPDWRRGDYQIRGVTHWQPLPAAPEVDNA
jgi:hypothetical protein